jgi:hypothetical protein
MANRKAFIKELANFLGGPNQVNMSILLATPNSSTGQLAKMWANIRQTTPLFGYPTVEETERVLTTFLFGEDVELRNL